MNSVNVLLAEPHIRALERWAEGHDLTIQETLAMVLDRFVEESTATEADQPLPSNVIMMPERGTPHRTTSHRTVPHGYTAAF